MTVIVSVKINDGIVLAADSAGTMNSGHVYTHANKITHLCDGLPVAAIIQKAIEALCACIRIAPGSSAYFAKKSGLLSGNPTEEDLDAAVEAVLQRHAP